MLNNIINVTYNRNIYKLTVKHKCDVNSKVIIVSNKINVF